ncbi:MAG: LysR family transcriptional regulator [Castellaniella sp.]|uniref:LysR substrate-binding domain-containing protein n=1 Tax=Castellaniella sp. TaxID=1955812 RepID=UPI001219A77E|nr:LysR substrate-binding domain-containing protein [Castellaniella sp.]TAN27684.1 MAG: LysR family transcriptional regulator [Castellaniella sp.]
MIGISIRQLEVFIAVATLGSVRRASEQLHLTQPAVSMALGDLERQLGAPLFDRIRGRLVLNTQGAEQLAQAREIRERLQDMQRRHADLQGALTGELRIGASNTVGNYLVGELLGPIVAQHPMIALHLTVDNTRDITRRLLDREIDLACVEGPVHHAQLETLPWRSDALVVCAAPTNPLALKARLAPQDFADAHWILRERGSATRSQTEQMLTSLPPGHILLELGQIEAIKQAVIAGLGIACLPAAATVDAVATGRLRVLHTPFLHLDRRLSLVLHRSHYRGTLIEAFLHSLEISPNAQD